MTKNLQAILLSDDPVEQLRTMHASGALKTLEPSLAALRMDIPAGFHHKDNLEHSFKVLQNSIDMEKGDADLVLRTAALFHDIGKPATRKFVKGGKVTFTNHDVVGARIVRQVLPKHGYTKQQTDQVARLVHMHMRSHTFKAGWSESAVRRLGVDAGDFDQLERLIIIFYADVTTKHGHRKDAIHKSVASLSAELQRVQEKDARAALRPAIDGHEVMELLNLQPGRELGAVMKFLNSDEGVSLSREDAIKEIRTRFQ